MSLPEYDMRSLLEAGVHFGHQKHRWNPKMAGYLFGVRGGVRIIDLSQTVSLLNQALQVISDTTARGGRMLIVGTKRQAQDAVAAAARRCAQYYVNVRWLGGMLTNWKTMLQSIVRLCNLEETLSSEVALGFTKKERLGLELQRRRLERILGGIKEMGAVPDLLFVVDTNRESIAIKEARRLRIPVIAILDSDCDPDGIAYPVPGNDDAGRAISLYMDLVANAALDGLSRAYAASGGVDHGAVVSDVNEVGKAPDAGVDAAAHAAQDVTQEVSQEATQEAGV